MTTKPSNAPWADEPFQLIATPSIRLDGSLDHVHSASEMASVHNAILRGLNAIIQQAPYVPDSTRENFSAQDVKDLLFFIQAWTKMVDHHHMVEESFMFPELEKLVGIPGYMDDPKHEHALFHGGIQKLSAYASATKPEAYRWDGPGGLKEIIDSFSGHMADHLYAEIETLLALGELKFSGLRKTWDETEKIAKKVDQMSALFDVFPVIIGLGDKTYEGGNTFPALPRVMPYMMKYWFAAGNGAWRFCPCDHWGRPRPLAFGPPPPATAAT